MLGKSRVATADGSISSRKALGMITMVMIFLGPGYHRTSSAVFTRDISSNSMILFNYFFGDSRICRGSRIYCQDRDRSHVVTEQARFLTFQYSRSL